MIHNLRQIDSLNTEITQRYDSVHNYHGQFQLQVKILFWKNHSQFAMKSYLKYQYVIRYDKRPKTEFLS